MHSHKIVLLPGDGIGPEITSVTKKVLEAISQKHKIAFNFEEKAFGGKAIEAIENPL